MLLVVTQMFTVLPHVLYISVWKNICADIIRVKRFTCRCCPLKLKGLYSSKEIIAVFF